MSTDHQKRKILIVEDDKLFLWSLDHFLRKEGYEVCPVATAELAIDLAQKESFDVVISDFHLPGFNGKQLIKRIKVLWPTIKAILISAYQREEMGVDDDEMALNGYLNKPIELGALKKLLETVTSSSGALTT